VLYNLQFTVIGAGNPQTTLSFVNPANSRGTFQFDNGSLEVNTANGLFTVIGSTATTVSLSGRVTTQSGKGIRNVMITMTDSNGNERTTTTTGFGYYRFENVTTGQSATVSAKAKRYGLIQSSIVRMINEQIDDADFVVVEQSR
ncbi:MAG TPA: carboxypeptidase regulatory-like domain-containing protein, partial [Pyrinomonadaceae bacterium]|jgi:hypothetical protein